jgi:Protein of unknown function (DUF3054)
MDIKERAQAPHDTSENTKGMSDIARITSLVIGDVIVFFVFSAIGRRSHNEAAGLSSLIQIAITAAPFAIGWFIVSPFVGAFKRGLEIRPGKMAQRTALSWVASWPVGFALRGIFVDHGVPPLTFAIVTLIANIILLLVWRVPFAWIIKARKG